MKRLTRKLMNSRKLYLAIMSACLFGIGMYFLFLEIALPVIALSISITLALAAAAALYMFASKLISRATRAFLGLTLVFGAIWFGVQNDVLAVAVLWAGVLFGALDSLGKLRPSRSVSVDLGGQAKVDQTPAHPELKSE